ncbi:MAG TPA: hypothetical protein VMM79_00655 [Longimicrobiales bacterium]|nr:hypothetical protein [Longimicrobiales bacterium]
MNEWFHELTRSSADVLEDFLRSGQAPSVETLVGSEFRGANIGAVPRRLGLQKFIKGFFHGPDSVEGYNIRVDQNGLDAPWTPKPHHEQPRRFGFYLVSPVRPRGRDSRYPNAILLDYGASPRNPGTRIERALRDYLVVPDPNRSDVLLGKAYLAAGPARLPVGFFVIERLRPTDWHP